MQITLSRGEAIARLKSAWPWGLLALWPLVLALANAKWMFNLPTFDPYVYLGAFLRLPAQLHAWGDLYFFTRLAFLLPGYIVYQLLPPLVANAVLDFAYYYGSVFILFDLLRRQLGVRPALFTALAIGGYSHFLSAIGWDYMNGAGAMYLLLAVWAASRSVASNHPWLWMVIAGLALGAGVHTHFFTLVFWPVVGLYWLLIWPSSWRLSRVLVAAMLVAAGILATTGLLGLASLLLGGRFAFFMGTYNFVRQLAGQTSNPWITTPVVKLLPSAGWLMAPAAVLVAALGGLWRGIANSASWWRSPRGAFVLIYLVGVALMGLSGLRTSTAFFSVEPYVSYLIPFMALALGALLAPALERLSSGQWRALLCVLVVSVPGAIVVASRLGERLRSLVSYSGGWVILCGLLLALCLVAVRRSDFVSLSTASLIFALVNPLGPSAPNALLFADAAMRREVFLKVVGGVRTIDAAWPAQEVWLWFNYREDEVYELIACAFSACHRRVVSREFPDLQVFGLDMSKVFVLAPGRRVVVLSEQPQAYELATVDARTVVTAPQVQFTRTVTIEGDLLHLLFLKVPELVWQIDSPPANWMLFQPVAAEVDSNGAFYADPLVKEAGYLAFGPYVSLPPGQYKVTFWLSTSQVGQLGQVATLDASVFTNPNDFRGSSLVVMGTDFDANMVQQPFELNFENNSPLNAIEFRVFTTDRIPLKLSQVQLTKLDNCERCLGPSR